MAPWKPILTSQSSLKFNYIYDSCKSGKLAVVTKLSVTQGPRLKGIIKRHEWWILNIWIWRQRQDISICSSAGQRQTSHLWHLVACLNFNLIDICAVNTEIVVALSLILVSQLHNMSKVKSLFVFFFYFIRSLCTVRAVATIGAGGNCPPPTNRFCPPPNFWEIKIYHRKFQ